MLQTFLDLPNSFNPCCGQRSSVYSHFDKFHWRASYKCQSQKKDFFHLFDGGINRASN